MFSSLIKKGDMQREGPIPPILPLDLITEDAMVGATAAIL